jgi:hypothetical protein
MSALAILSQPRKRSLVQISLGGVRHNLPQEAPPAFAKAVVDVDGF